MAKAEQHQAQQGTYGKKYAVPESAWKLSYFSEDSSSSDICGNIATSRSLENDGLFLDAPALCVGDLDTSN